MAKQIEINENTMCSCWCDCSFYKGTQGFEFLMKYGDCTYCCHMGVCDYECSQILSVDYIRKQLDEISNEQMFGYILECICDDDISDKITDRDWLEMYLVWLVAGDIIDEVSTGENLESLVVS